MLNTCTGRYRFGESEGGTSLAAAVRVEGRLRAALGQGLGVRTGRRGLRETLASLDWLAGEADSGEKRPEHDPVRTYFIAVSAPPPQEEIADAQPSAGYPR
jgi:hypothetical protein